MAGYGGQLVALNANTPSETELATAQADEAQSRAQVLRATAPAQISLMRQQAVGAGIANQANALTLQQQIQLNTYRQNLLANQQQAQAPSPLASAAGSQTSQPDQTAPQSSLLDPRVQQVMQSINPDDPEAPAKWDQQMDALAKDGVPQAQQFVGHYSRPNVTGWRSQIGVHAAQNPSPLASTAPAASVPATPAVGVVSPLGAPAQPPVSPVAGQSALAPAAPVSPLTGKPDPDLAAMAIIDPKGTAEFLKLQGMMRYQQTGNMQDLARYAPEMYLQLTEAQKNLTATQKEALGTKSAMMGSAANAVLTLAHKLGPGAPEVRSAYNSSIADAARQGWMDPKVAQQLIQSPIDFARLSVLATTAETVAENMKTSGQEAGNEAAAKAPYDQHYQYAGTNAQSGTAVGFNTRTGRVVDTGVTIGPKPSAAMGNFQSKHDMWLSANPGDEKGALEFANGKRDMSPTQIAVAAQTLTAKQQSNAVLAGQQGFDYNTAYQQNLATLQQAATTPAAPTTPAPAQGSPTAVNAKGYTQAQASAAAHYTQTGVLPGYGHVGFDPKAPKGSIKNPVAPRTAHEYASLPAGTIYIGQDGIPRQKKK